MSDLTDAMKTDALVLIVEWGTTVSVKRHSTSYSTDLPVKSWVNTETNIQAVKQPLTGINLKEIEMLKLSSNAFFVFEYDTDILKDDRIYVGSIYYTVDHFKSFESHIEVYATIQGV